MGNNTYNMHIKKKTLKGKKAGKKYMGGGGETLGKEYSWYLKQIKMEDSNRIRIQQIYDWQCGQNWTLPNTFSRFSHTTYALCGILFLPWLPIEWLYIILANIKFLVQANVLCLKLCLNWTIKSNLNWAQEFGDQFRMLCNGMELCSCFLFKWEEETAVQKCAGRSLSCASSNAKAVDQH